MKVFALLLPILLFTSCSTMPMVGDWFHDGDVGFQEDEFPSYWEEEASEPTVVEHDIRIPYDFSFPSELDWETLKENRAVPEPDPEPVALVVEAPKDDPIKPEPLSGDMIIFAACMVIFLICLMIITCMVTRRRRYEDYYYGPRPPHDPH